MKNCCFTLLLLLLVSVSPQQLLAQKFLLLQRGANEKTKITYEIGEEFSYKTKDYDFYITDVITDIQTDILVLKENVLRPEDIQTVDIRYKDERNRRLESITAKALGGGVLFLIGFTATSLVQEGNLSQLRETWPYPTVLFASGLILSQIRYRNFKNEGKNKIQLVILPEEEDLYR